MLLISSIQQNNIIVNLQSLSIKPLAGNANSWMRVVKTFYIPRGLPGDCQINFHIWNKDKKTFFVDDVRIKY